MLDLDLIMMFIICFAVWQTVCSVFLNETHHVHIFTKHSFAIISPRLVSQIAHPQLLSLAPFLISQPFLATSRVKEARKTHKERRGGREADALASELPLRVMSVMCGTSVVVFSQPNHICILWSYV